MSTTETPIDPDKQAEEAVEENRDLLERVAAADLAISEDIQRILKHVDGGDK